MGERAFGFFRERSVVTRRGRSVSFDETLLWRITRRSLLLYVSDL